MGKLVELGFTVSDKHIHCKTDVGYMKPMDHNPNVYFWITSEGMYLNDPEVIKTIRIQIVGNTVKGSYGATVEQLSEIIDFMLKHSFLKGKQERSREFKRLIES